MTIFTPSSRCTSGFVAKNRKNQTYLLTAGHCVENGQSVWTGHRQSNHSWTRHIGVATNSRDDSNTDSARIYVNSNWKRTRWQRLNSRAQAMHIKGILDQRGSRGQYICQSGSTSGLQCGRVVNESARLIAYGKPGHENIIRYDFWTSTMPVQGGDSGGGVFVPFDAAKNASKAYGLVGGYVKLPDGTHLRSDGPGIRSVLQKQNLILETGR